MTDPIADLLTRIRNAIMAGHKVVEAPASNLKKEVARILQEKGYILSYKVAEEEGKGKQGVLKIALKYNQRSKQPAIKGIRRVSRPGLRQYTGVEDMPRVLNGLGIAIISTSKGLMTDKEARKENIGGEVLCYVY
jgi:small subunit ribosomal protein S8